MKTNELKRILVAAALIPLCLSAETGPGTYFNPKDGNAVAPAARPAKGAVTRTVAFLGGSITEMNGFRPLVMRDLRARHPDVAFREIAAGLSSTCSDTGALRLRRDVLEVGVPDVLVVDAVVNDDQDGHFDRTHAVRGLEGIVRQALDANPRCAIVLALMVNCGQYNQLMAGKTPPMYAVEREVAAHYGLAVADVGGALAASARAGGLNWKGYRDCHPSPEGCALGAKTVLAAIDSVFDPKKTRPVAASVKPMDPASYARPRALPLSSVDGGGAWRVSRPDWKSVPGAKRAYFTKGDVLWCAETNRAATVRFRGGALAALMTAGPDAGDLEVSVDGGAWRLLRLRALYGGLHYPYTQMIAEGLSDGEHTARLRVVPARRGASVGTTVRLNWLYEISGCDAAPAEAKVFERPARKGQTLLLTGDETLGINPPAAARNPWKAQRILPRNEKAFETGARLLADRDLFTLEYGAPLKPFAFTVPKAGTNFLWGPRTTCRTARRRSAGARAGVRTAATISGS